MSTTQLKVYYLVLSKREESDSTTTPKVVKVSTNEFDDIFTGIIDNMPLRKKSKLNRFFTLTGSEPKWILLHADDSGIPEKSGFIQGLFVKSRTSKWPYKEDVNGKVSQILEINGMAEVSYFIIDKNNGVVIYTANQFVGGHKSFQNYLNEKILELRNNTTLNILKSGKKEYLCELNLIINSINIEDLVKKSTIKKYNMRLVRPKNYDKSTIDLPLNSETDIFVNNLKWVKTQNIEFLAGRSNDLPGKRLKNWISFARENRDIVTRADVLDEDSRVIDLLGEDYVLNSMIDYTKKYMPHQDVFNSLMSEYKSKQTVIRKCIDYV